MAPKIKRTVGLDRLVTLFQSENVWFVDGVNGSASNAGDIPGASVAKPSEAIAKAAMWGVIYIAPMQYATYATISNRYYIDNVTVPIGKAGVQFIGAGPGGTHYQTVEIKTSAAGSHVFDVYAPGVQFRNMRLTGTSQTAVTGLGNPDLSVIRAMGDGSTNKANGGLGVFDCTFSNAKAGGAIRIDNPWNCVVDNCIFHNCYVGVWSSSSVSSTNGMWIKDCMFEGQPANIDTHIYATGGSSNCYGLLIDRNTFNTALPAHASGALKRFIYVGDTWSTGGGGLISNNCFAFDTDNNTGLCGAAGTQILVPTTIWMAGNFAEANTDAEGLITRV